MSRIISLDSMPHEKLPKGVICPLCLWIMESPKACHHCQQSFCEACLAPWLKHTPNCPKCEGYVTPKILLDTSALVESLLLEYAHKCLPEYARYESECIDQKEIQRKNCSHSLLRCAPRRASSRNCWQPSQRHQRQRNRLPRELVLRRVAHRIEEYFKSLDGLQKNMQELLSAMNMTRKVTWKARALKTEQQIDLN